MPKLQTPKTEPKDVFFHLLAIISLYTSAFNLGMLFFSLVSFYLPDLATLEPQLMILGSLRWSLSWLVVTFPVYLWVSRFIEKDLQAHPEKRERRIHKWLWSLTLFLAAIVIGGDLVTLVNNYLSGELTPRFAIKVLVVFAIAASVFNYYLWNLREGKPVFSNLKMKIFVLAVVGATLGAIVWGFIVAGSPATERLRRLDERRVQDLSQIQSRVSVFWQSEKRLPKNLAELGKAPDSSILTDPETGVSYEYKPGDDLKFELCAIFAGEAEWPEPLYYPKMAPARIIDSWNHPAGHYCFARKANQAAPLKQ